MKIDLLGPIRVTADHGEIVLSAAKERALLATLALRPDTVVSSDELVDAVWGEQPPATARKTLQTYVSNLRRALGAEVLGTQAAGYVLRVSPNCVDVKRFRDLVREGSDANRNGSTPRARRLLCEAVALWRGDPLSGVPLHAGLAAAAVRLREELLSALEARLDADLRCGCHATVVAELEMLTAQHPFRERLWGQLMVALYRSGRQADALAAYERARRLLHDDLGLEPGGELRRIERAILDHDPFLASDTEPGSPVVPSSEIPLLRSPVRYAVTDDGVHVAYQVFGDGPVDVLVIPGWVSHLDLWWDAPTDQLVRRLGSFSRVIVFDKRGTGLSDRPSDVQVEQWVDDASAVLDAAGSDQAVVFGIGCASTPVMFAAAHADRTSALVLFGTQPRTLDGDGYEFGRDRHVIDAFNDRLVATWGSGAGLSAFAPSLAHNADAHDFWARYQRLSSSPGAAAAFFRAIAYVDVRHLLPAISAPALIIQVARDRAVPAGAGRLMADLIPDATYVELDSDIHLIWLSDVVDQITDEVEAFITRTIRAVRPERVLSTVMCVGGPRSTRRDERIRSIVEHHHGEQHRTTGRVTFDGPSRAVRCALTLARDLDVGVAVHSGECELLANGDLKGVVVDVATQLALTAEPGEVLVSHTVEGLLVGSEFRLERRRTGCLDTAPDQREIHAVVAPRSGGKTPPELRTTGTA